MRTLESLCFKGPAVGRLRMLRFHQDLVLNNINFQLSRNKEIFKSSGSHSLKGHLYFANRNDVPKNLASNNNIP